MNGTDVKRPSAAETLTGVGGLIMVIGAFLPFAKVDTGQLEFPSQSVQILETPDGKWVLGAGILLLALAVVIWMVSLEVRRFIAIFVVAVGVAILWVAIADILRVQSKGLQSLAESAAAENPGVSVEQLRAALEQFEVSVNTGIGLYVTLGGAAFAVIGGLVGLLAKKPDPMLPPSPPPPAPPPMEPTGP